MMPKACYRFQMTISPTAASTRDWIMIFVLALIWGGSFLFGRILMLEWPPFTVVFLRVAIAAAVLWTVSLKHRACPLGIDDGRS